MAKNCFGKCANHLVIEVPLGTVVKSIDREKIGDLDQQGSMFILARGGAGGKGNSFFASATNQSPLVAERGAKGEVCDYILEVKSMANFGLVGFPNAGKSTLLQAISRAKPKVASYPFTTLKPYVGVVQYDDYEQITNLPGLIEGSHLNRGLGIQFLRHLERCSCLIYILDAANDPINDFKILKNELYQYDPNLLKRPYIVLANKVDLPEIEENLLELKKEETVFPISAKFGTNLKELLIKMREIFDSHNCNNTSQ